MPTSSTITAAAKAKIKSSLPSSQYKILTATVARVYAAIGDGQWSYTGIEGGLAFVRLIAGPTADKGACGFRVVDLKGSRGIIWDHDIYENMQYNQDRGFFHTFEGDEFLIAFSFADEGEANDFYKKVNSRAKYAKSSSKSGSSGTPSGSTIKKKKGVKGGIDKSMISAPSGFQHVAHMGFSTENGFSSNNVDPTWAALLDQLTSMGVSEKDIQKNEKFIKDFVGQRGGPAQAAAPSAQPAVKVKKVPPPAPSRGPASARKQPPPPPAPRSRPGVPPPPASATSAPPPPPARSSGGYVPPPPPPPPARTSISGPPPPPSRPAGRSSMPPPPAPPPPARGSVGGGAPPPPPPPPPSSNRTSGAGPPPPPAPPAAPPGPSPGEPRGALLASIQGAGLSKLKKTDPSLINDRSSVSLGGGGGGGSGPSQRSTGGAPPIPGSAAALAGGAALGAGAGAGAGVAYAASGGGGEEDEGQDASPGGGSGGGGGGDLASALAAALSQRKGNMGESDEEGESDDEW